MMTETPSTTSPAQDQFAGRVLLEGYGPGAWHGADMKAAISDVRSTLAFWRPGPDRHNIAEIALHHAFYVWSVRGRLTGAPTEPFIREGEDWFPLSSDDDPAWDRVRDELQREYDRLTTLVASIAAGTTTSPLSPSERFDLVLGITCHAVYHAGQIQLITALRKS